jgi:Protein of unknown function (DUF3631)
VRGCGKTTLLALLELLTAEPCRTDNVSAASIYHLLSHAQYTTLYIDEGDNLGLISNPTLRSIFNSGHRRGGNVRRYGSQRFDIFAPLAVAAIGTLPLPLMHRAVVVKMQRSETQVERLDENDPSFPASRDLIKRWAATCSLAPDPEIPSSIRNRAADNWRVLLSIADGLGHSDDARAAAVELCRNRPDEDPGVVLLRDIQTVFFAHGVDRLSSVKLVEELINLNDGLWHDWRGPE